MLIKCPMHKICCIDQLPCVFTGDVLLIGFEILHVHHICFTPITVRLTHNNKHTNPMWIKPVRMYIPLICSHNVAPTFSKFYHYYHSNNCIHHWCEHCTISCPKPCIQVCYNFLLWLQVSSTHFAQVHSVVIKSKEKRVVSSDALILILISIYQPSFGGIGCVSVKIWSWC